MSTTRKSAKASSQTRGESGVATIKAADRATGSMPPWGTMCTAFLEDVQTRPIPVGFAVNGVAGTLRDWDTFVQAQVDDLGDFLWPRYAPGDANGPWIGKAAKTMWSLTEIDLKVLRTLRPKLFAPVTVAGRALPAVHRALFEKEDYDRERPAFATLAHYLENAAPELRIAVREAADKRFAALGPAPLRLKFDFQRIRPHQAAAMLGQEPLDNEWAKSGVTPALVSGHALQGLIGFGGALLDKRRALTDIAGGVEGMLQMMVDYGDRRVMAGVHYPSDNAASWLIAMRLCPLLYGQAAGFMKSALWQAVEQRSVVYRAIVAHASSDPNYKRIVEELQKEGKAPASPSANASAALAPERMIPDLGASSSAAEYHPPPEEPKTKAAGELVDGSPVLLTLTSSLLPVGQSIAMPPVQPSVPSSKSLIATPYHPQEPTGDEART